MESGFVLCEEDWLYSRAKQYHSGEKGKIENTQHSKLKHSGLSPYFKQVITSEGSNSLKPNKEIFDFAFQKTGATPDESIMIGDTMEVDILGAINAGIDQIHVNHLTNEPESINGKLPTHTVYSLKELEGIF